MRVKRESKQDLAKAVRERYGRAGRQEKGRIPDVALAAAMLDRLLHHSTTITIRGDSYLNEFDFRFSRRKISDAERFEALMGQTRGRVLWFCQSPQAENPHA